MRHRTTLSIAAAVVATAAMAGCAQSPSATPTVTTTTTVTATATVTATPAPLQQSASDPMTPLVAWSICAGIASHSGTLDPKDWTLSPYQDNAVTAKDSGAYEVMLGFAPTGAGYGAGFNCTVGGTIGAPTIADVRGPYDFG